jgi:membrane-associated phospholipid phosphatase
METLLNAQLFANTLLQSLGGWLTAIMEGFSFLGTEDFFLLFIPILYWSVDARAGIKIGLILILSNLFGSAFKMAFHTPRPYWFAPGAVTAFANETSFGFPSIHSLTAASVWGLSAWLIRHKGRLWIAPAVVIVMVGLSRLYLGVHFLWDVLGGWALVLLLVWAFLKLEKPVGAWAAKFSLAAQVGLAAAAALIGMALNWLVKAIFGGFEAPAQWAANAGHALAGFDLTGVYTVCGLLFGLLAGMAWIARRGGYSAKGSLDQRALRYVIGVIGVLLFWYGLKMVLPAGEDLLGVSMRLLRYALVGLWVSALAPAVFIRLKLAQPEQLTRSDAVKEAV